MIQGTEPKKAEQKRNKIQKKQAPRQAAGKREREEEKGRRRRRKKKKKKKKDVDGRHHSPCFHFHESS